MLSGLRFGNEVWLPGESPHPRQGTWPPTWAGPSIRWAPLEAREGTSGKSEVLFIPAGASALGKALLQSSSLGQKNSLENSSGCHLRVLEGKAWGTGLVSYLQHSPPFTILGWLGHSKCMRSMSNGWAFPGEMTLPTKEPACFGLTPWLFGSSPPSTLIQPTLFPWGEPASPTREAPGSGVLFPSPYLSHSCLGRRGDLTLHILSPHPSKCALSGGPIYLSGPRIWKASPGLLEHLPLVRTRAPVTPSHQEGVCPTSLSYLYYKTTATPVSPNRC